MPCLADLTITIYPGKQFSQGDRPTIQDLNQLGTPTAQVTGTLGGTNIALGAGTVSGTMLMDSVAGSNLTWNAASPRGLVVKNSGISFYQLATAAFGTGLTGGGGVAVEVTNVPVTRITVTTNTIVGGGPGNYLTVGNGLHASAGTLSLSNFTSIEYSLASGLVADTNHNLGTTPVMVRWVLVCKTADLGFSVGDEVDVAHFYNNVTANQQFSSGGNATNVFLLLRDTGNINVRKKSDGDDGSITASRWRAKAYARP